MSEELPKVIFGVDNGNSLKKLLPKDFSQRDKASCFGLVDFKKGGGLVGHRFCPGNV